jgi:molybdate transport system substrate-binding protein
MRCGEPGGEAPRLYAAASLSAADDGLRAARGDAALELLIGGTSTVARQLLEGAPPGCFLGADQRWADELESAGIVEPGTRIDLLTNSLVVIAPADSTLTIERLDQLAEADLDRIALADPDAVPAGRYAREALHSVDIWEALAPRVVGCADVRAATALVAAGEVDAGIVYATDARTPGVRVVHEIDRQHHPTITYPLLLVKGAPPAARELWEWLQTEPARAAFRDAGFTAVER